MFISIVYASELQISKITIYVNDEDQGSLKNNSVYSDSILPGDDLSFEIEVENLFKKDIDINDITIEGIIYNITENKDLIDNITEFDLNSDSSKLKNLQFEIPTDADELQKKLEITIQGIDDNKQKQVIKWNIYLNIEDEEHNIILDKTRSDQKIDNCKSEKNLIVLMYNNGEFDESNAAFTVKNKELNLDRSYSGINIDKGVISTKVVPISSEEVTKRSIFLIEIKAYYKGTRLDDVRTINLEVDPCKEDIILNESVSGTEDNIIQELNPAIKDLSQENTQDNASEEVSKPRSKTAMIIIVSSIILVISVFIIIIISQLMRR
jgi:hypothetical protein